MMKAAKTIAMVFLVGLLMAADDPNADAAKKESAKIEGTWVVIKYEGPGANDDGSLKEIRTYTFKDGKVTIKDGDKITVESPFQIDSTKSPKTIDFDFSVKDVKVNPKKEKSPGIYKLDGDSLIICHTVFGFPRPKKFSTDQKAFLITMKRETETKK